MLLHFLRILFGNLLEVVETFLEILQFALFELFGRFAQRLGILLIIQILVVEFDLDRLQLALLVLCELLVFGQGRITFRHGSDQLLRVDIAEFLRISRTTAQQQRCKQG